MNNTNDNTMTYTAPKCKVFYVAPRKAILDFSNEEMSKSVGGDWDYESE